MPDYFHVAEPALFREALAQAERRTGFQALMIEKDYYCSLVLAALFQEPTDLIFKGGTCLSKVYADFYRMSEDLDFVIPIQEDVPRNQRRSRIRPIKRRFESLPSAIDGIHIAEPLVGHFKNQQYIGRLAYASVVLEAHSSIKVEIALREPLLQAAEWAHAKTLVENPFIAGQPIVSVYQVQAMSLPEVYAEKFRAALTRREPAIRDFFDLSPAVLEAIPLSIHSPDFVALVKAKLKVAGNEPVDVSPSRKDALRQQLTTQLRPVLRPSDYSRFGFDAAFDRVAEMAALVGEG